jgi:hypothetical protein
VSFSLGQSCDVRGVLFVWVLWLIVLMKRHRAPNPDARPCVSHLFVIPVRAS